MSKTGGWIGVDLDGSLAMDDGYYENNHIGEPIPLMRARVVYWLKEGKEVRILTARANRVSYQDDDTFSSCIKAIEVWCLKHLGQVLPITCSKDFRMIELWDDRAIQLIPNTGKRADGVYP